MKRIKKFNELNESRRDFKPNYGLMVIDPREEGDKRNILHYCAYEKEPTQKDADQLREELRTEEEFGLQDIADIVEIYPATEEVVEHFRKGIEEDQIKMDIHGDELV